MTQVTKITQQVDSIMASLGQLRDDEYETKITDLENDVSEKDQEIEDLENSRREIGFEPISEYSFNSFAGEMALYSSSLADDPVLDLFSTLAANIKPADLLDDLRRILSRYPDLVKRHALEHFVIT